MPTTNTAAAFAIPVTTETVLTVDTGRGYSQAFAVGHVARGKTARREIDGAMVAGPWAYAYELATAVDNRGHEKAERLRRLQRGLMFEIVDGMAIAIDGETYTARVRRRWGEIELCFE